MTTKKAPATPATAAKKPPAKTAGAVKATKRRAEQAPVAAAASKTAAPVKAASKAAASKAAPAKAAPAKAAPAKSAPAKSAPAKAASAAGKKAGKAAPVTDKFLLKQLALLHEERGTYEEQAASLKAQADQLAQEMEPGDTQFDDESGEGGTMNVDRERDLALSAKAREAVEEIDHALARIQSGTYGKCEQCGQPIPKARLEAMPFARLCVACKSGGLSRR